MNDKNKVIGFGPNGKIGGKTPPLSVGLKTGGKFRQTVKLLNQMAEEFQKSKVDPIDCPNCGSSFYILAGFDDNLRQYAVEYYNQVNDPEETGFDRILFISKEEYQNISERVIPEDNCHWHEELEEL